jgi:ABC-type branched-subunit amino acid transport system substrate-binding protein
MNAKKVPQLFVATGATKWGNPKKYPWTMGWQPPYSGEAMNYAAYLMKTKPDAKVAILFQNDDYGKDYLNGFIEGLGDKAKTMVVAKASYEVTDPTVDPQIIQLKNSGADTFFNITTPKFAAQAIRKAYDSGWKPLHFLNNVSSSVGSVLKPAGLDKSKGVITAQYLKDPTDPQWKGQSDYEAWVKWMDKYYADGDKTNAFNVYGYAAAATMVEVLKKAGDNLTRENLMKAAASLKDVDIPMLLPGVKVDTGASDFYPIQCEQLSKFDGEKWALFGDVICPH